MNWAIKIASFLNRMPYYALFPDKADELKKTVIGTALNNSATDIDFSKIDQITSIASSLDIPPFVKDMDRNCFKASPIITNLLSGQQFSFSLPEIEFETVHNHLINTIEKIKKMASSDESLFLALWRFLPEKLAENDPCKIGPYWHILPADPCIPSHTIWEHSSVASAISSAFPDPHLLIFTIASAQELVTTARRTQDAWMGSFLLSYLSWQGVKVIADTCGPDTLIFPSLKYQPIADLWLHNEKGFKNIDINSQKFKSSLEVGNIPNIFTAIVPGNIAQSLANKAEEAIKTTWEKISEDVRIQSEETIKQAWGKDISSSWKTIWDRQRDGFINDLGIFWSICPWGNDLNKILEAAMQNEESESMKYLKSFITNIKEKNYSTNIGMGYHPVSGFAAKGLTARKNLRDFQNIPEPGHKCTLCGKWEALHPVYSDIADVADVSDIIKNKRIKDAPEDEANSYRWLLAFWQAFGDISRKNDLLKLKGRVRKGERLCSLCLTRRLAMEVYFEKQMTSLDHHLFPSTAGICTADFKGNIIKAYLKDQNTWKPVLENFVSKIRNFIRNNNLPHPSAYVDYYNQYIQQDSLLKEFLKIDGDWLFKDSFDTNTLEHMYNINDPDTIEKCRDEVEKLNKTAKKNELKTPSTYYAIIAMDGDKMGEWLTGRRAPKYDWLFHPIVKDDILIDNIIPAEFKRPLGPALQLGLSDSLKNYALYLVRKIVETEHPGKLIYAGGDDVLAFVPVEHLFDVMEKLYLNFQGDKNGFMIGNQVMRLMGGVRQIKGEISEDKHQGMSVSMGVIILHHSYPLYHALNQAQEVLKKTAKEKLGRDAFAIRLIRRSGEFTEAGFKFTSSETNQSCDIIIKMKKIFKLFTDDLLSSRLPYRMAENLWAKGSNNNSTIQKACETELIRLTKQHTRTKEKDQIKMVYNNVIDFFKNIKLHLNAEDTQSLIDPWELTSNLLMILRFMAGKGESHVA